MKEQLTAVFQKVPERYIAFVEELPEAHSQSETLDEARSNLPHAVQLVPSDPVSSGMTLTVLPSTTHSSVVLGPIFSFFRSLRWNRDLSACSHFGTHKRRFTMQ